MGLTTSRSSLPPRRRIESKNKNASTGRRGNTGISIITIARGQERGATERSDGIKIARRAAIAIETVTGTEKGIEMVTGTTGHARTMRTATATGTSALDIPRMTNKNRAERTEIGTAGKIKTEKRSPNSSSLQTRKRSFRSLTKRRRAVRANHLPAIPG